VRCPTKSGGVACGLETKASRVGHLQNQRGELLLFDHYECQSGHRWHFNVREEKIEPCNCDEDN